MSAISIQLPEEIDACLQVIPASTGRTKSDYFLEAIREHLEDLQDIFIAEQRLADLRAGRTQAISLEQVERNPGLADSVRFQEEKDLSRLDRQTAKRIRGTWMSACPASMTREASGGAKVPCSAISGDIASATIVSSATSKTIR